MCPIAVAGQPSYCCTLLHIRSLLFRIHFVQALRLLTALLPTLHYQSVCTIVVVTMLLYIYQVVLSTVSYIGRDRNQS